MTEKLNELKSRIADVTDLRRVNSVLSWDQSTYMPPEGAAARGRQMATISKLAHEKFIDDKVGNLLNDLSSEVGLSDDDAALVAVLKKDFDKAVRVPASFLAEFSSHAAASYQAWTEARAANDFPTMQPIVEKNLDLSRQYAQYLGYDSSAGHIADPLIDAGDEGMTVATVRPIFAALREELVPLVKAVAEQDAIDDSCILKFFPHDKQLAFGKRIAQDFGYDFDRGRLDLTYHPFCTTFSVNDVRITTRINDNDFGDCLFSVLHETGHGLYELGVSQSLEGTPLADGTSSGVHESQSRLWENIVGRSHGCWQHYFPILKDTFPDELAGVDLETFYKAINKVSPGLIRVDADELTYNLHVILRFELECQLLEGSVEIKDLPEIWHSRYESDLGVRAPSDVDGVLQDVHWYAGTIGGAFQGYTLGNILSAQFYDAAVAAQPSIPSDISKGEFQSLHRWLKDNIYQHGRKLTASEVTKQASGQDLNIDPYMSYLRGKYGALYSL